MNLPAAREARQTTSRTGWWIAGLLERHDDSDRAKYWHNYRLIQAGHWRDAFQKALTFGRRDAEIGCEAFRGTAVFMGVTTLNPIYDAFEDGAEVLWEEIGLPEDSRGKAPPDVFSEEEMAAIYEPACP